MWENCPVGGYTVDLAIGEGTAAIGVECGVHPGGIDAHIARHSALRRAGWELMSAMESRYLARPEDAAEAIIRKVVQRDGPTSTQRRPNDPGGQ
jgi:very-short-patch-repair endonuclease